MIKTKHIFAATVIATTFFSCQDKGASSSNEQISSEMAAAKAFSDDPEIMKHFITMDSANKMIQSYLTSVSFPNDTTMRDKNLHSLILDAEALRSYLADTSIKEVKVMLAHTLDFINAGNEGVNAGYKPDALTVVIAGYNKAGNYVFGPDNKVPNRAMPCPNYCPIIGTASNSLLE